MLTAWNGLMISAFAEAARVLDRRDYLDVARRGVAFILTHLSRQEAGGLRLLRSYKDGQAKFNAYLDDYACFAAALLDVYEAGFEAEYLDRAVGVTDAMLAQFWDADAGGFFYTSADHETLITRSKSSFDGSVPSGNSVAASMLLRLYHLTENSEYLAKAETLFKLFYDAMQQNPFGFANLLCAFDFYARKPKEVVLLGDPAAADTRALLRNVHRLFVPNKTVRCFDPRGSDRDGGPRLPGFLADTPPAGQGGPTAYVCHNFTCSLPTMDWDGLRALLVPAAD